MIIFLQGFDAFESVIQPDHYIRHYVHLLKVDYCRAVHLCHSTLKNDMSFKIDAPSSTTVTTSTPITTTATITTETTTSTATTTITTTTATTTSRTTITTTTTSTTTTTPTTKTTASTRKTTTTCPPNSTKVTAIATIRASSAIKTLPTTTITNSTTTSPIISKMSTTAECICPTSTHKSTPQVTSKSALKLEATDEPVRYTTSIHSSTITPKPTISELFFSRQSTFMTASPLTTEGIINYIDYASIDLSYDFRPNFDQINHLFTY